MARGGKRIGAGRKKGPEGEAYRQALLTLIDQFKDGLAQALVDKGLAGDVPALKEINERALGKVKDSIDLTSKGKQIKSINYIVPNGDNAPADPETTPSEPGAERP